MKLARPPRTRLRRALFRAPIWLYRLGLGGLLGGRFLLLTHTGRTSGRPRQVVLEVVGRHEPSGGYLIASGYGERSQWFRNILEDPRVCFQVGWRRYRGLARPLPAAESGRWLADYARRHPGPRPRCCGSSATTSTGRTRPSNGWERTASTASRSSRSGPRARRSLTLSNICSKIRHGGH